MSSSLLLTQFLLALKQEKKLLNFTQKRKIYFDVNNYQKAFILSSIVYSEDSYIPPNILTYIREKKFENPLETLLKVDPSQNHVHLKQFIPYDHQKNPRQVLINFADLALQYIKILDDLSNDEIFLVKNPL